MWMKVTGCICVVTCSFLLGNYYGSCMDRRLFGLRQVYFCMQLLRGEISYRHATLAEAFSQLTTRCDEALYGWLSYLGAELRRRNAAQFVEVWEASLERLSCDTALRKEDISLLREFGSNLGYLNLELQEARIVFFMERLAGVMEELSGELSQRKRLYRTMGLLGGIFLMLLLV